LVADAARLASAVEEELLACDLVVGVDRVHATSSSVICLPVPFGVTLCVKWTANWLGPLKNGPRMAWKSNVLSATQSSDFLITGCCPFVSRPSPSTETMSGAYSVRMTSKFLP
jgi:hypothetical protein